MLELVQESFLLSRDEPNFSFFFEGCVHQQMRMKNQLFDITQEVKGTFNVLTIAMVVLKNELVQLLLLRGQRHPNNEICLQRELIKSQRSFQSLGTNSGKDVFLGPPQEMLLVFGS